MTAFRTILVATDFSDHAARALDTACHLAKRFEAKLVIAHAYEVPVHGLAPYGFEVAVDLLERVHAEAARRLDALVADAVARGVDASPLASSDTPSQAIVAAAEDVDADLVVMGTRGHTGLKHALLGSVAERTLRTAPCSVLAVKVENSGEAVAEPKKILVATDFSKPGEQAMSMALDLAKTFGAELHLAHAFDLRVPFVTPYEVAIPDHLIEDARRTAGELLDKEVALAAGAGVEATAHLAEVPAARAITELAGDLAVDMIVIGTHGHTGIKHAVLGSVAEKTVRLSPCSVLTVKATASEDE